MCNKNKTSFVIDMRRMCAIKPITISNVKKLMLLKTFTIINYSDCSIFESRKNIIKFK